MTHELGMDNETMGNWAEMQKRHPLLSGQGMGLNDRFKNKLNNTQDSIIYNIL